MEVSSSLAEHQKLLGKIGIDDETRQQNTRNKMLHAGIPPRFVGMTLDGYQAPLPKQQSVMRKVRGYSDEFPKTYKTGKSMMLLGGVGTGKTHLACAIVQRILLCGGSARYVTAMNAIRSIRETWGKGAEKSERDVVEAFAKLDLLVLDEVGQQQGTDNELVLLYDIINARYDQQRPTIIVSNYGVAKVTDYLGERVIDRLRENGGAAVLFDWPSYRKNGKSE